MGISTLTTLNHSQELFFLNLFGHNDVESVSSHELANVYLIFV